MAGDVHIMHVPTVAALRTDLRDGGLMDVVLIDVVLIDVVLMDTVRRFGAASKGVAPSEAFAVGSMEDPGAANQTCPDRSGN